MAVGVDNVEETQDVVVFHLLEERDLANGGAGDAFIFGFEADLLEGDDFAAIGEVAGFVDDTVSA